jgi:hypothetical protein
VSGLWLALPQPSRAGPVEVWEKPWWSLGDSGFQPGEESMDKEARLACRPGLGVLQHQSSV